MKGVIERLEEAKAKTKTREGRNRGPEKLAKGVVTHGERLLASLSEWRSWWERFDKAGGSQPGDNRNKLSIMDKLMWLVEEEMEEAESWIGRPFM